MITEHIIDSGVLRKGLLAAHEQMCLAVEEAKAAEEGSVELHSMTLPIAG